MLDDRQFGSPARPSLKEVPLGVDVCDVSGEKVGTVAHIYHPSETDQVIEVKTGFLGLGKHLYVTPDEINALTDGGVILKHPKQEFHSVGLDAKPENLAG